MASKNHLHSRPMLAKSPAESNGAGILPPEVANVLAKVQTLLQDQCPEKALDTITGSRLASPWITNATGVCLLRLGNAKQASGVFQGLVVYSGVLLKPDAPMVFKTNYAAALLASGNLMGCLSVLNEIHEEENPAVRQLRAAIQRWKQSLPWWQKLKWYLGDVPERPVILDFSLGELQ